MKPLLALKCPKGMKFDDYLSRITFPQLVTPKIDFIRCYTIETDANFRQQTIPGFERCLPQTRSGKNIPNPHASTLIALNCYPWLDGELGAGTTFQDSGLLMRLTGTPEICYHVFDCMIHSRMTYKERIGCLELKQLPDFCNKIIPTQVNNLKELLDYEAEQLALGMEGIMCRPPNSLYDTGYADNRATFNIPWLIAIKRFEDGEATVIGFEELMTNNNPQTPDYLGRMKRSSHQENQIPAGTLGALRVKDLVTGAEFNIGSGFTKELRDYVWANRSVIEKEIVKYKWQKHGTLDRPRIPTFQGFRDVVDMS